VDKRNRISNIPDQSKVAVIKKQKRNPVINKKNNGLGIDFAALMALNLLHEYVGFRATEQLENKIKYIFRNSGSDELREWISHMEKDPSRSDLNALVDDLANKETYFFRDKNQLDIYSEYLLPKLIKDKLHNVQNTINIWSAGCSTGEEAYTLAMLLCDKLIDAKIAIEGASNEIFVPSAWDISILGTDISSQAIRVAKEGNYEKGGFDSFRQFPESYLKFFNSEDQKDILSTENESIHLQINKSISQIVQFDQSNLLGNDVSRNNIDIIFCRNVLMNIDPDRHNEILLMMHKSLNDGGILVLSPIDVIPVPGLFNEVWVNKCLVYEKAS